MCRRVHIRGTPDPFHLERSIETTLSRPRDGRIAADPAELARATRSSATVDRRTQIQITRLHSHGSEKRALRIFGSIMRSKITARATSTLIFWASAVAGYAGCGAPPDARLESDSSAVTACADHGVVEGVDVSDAQGTIDWFAAKAGGIDFAFMKATQGTYYSAGTFERNWQGAKAAGVIRSAYHFFDPTEDGAAQAEQFLAVIGGLADGDLAPMLDVECPDSDNFCLGWAGGTGWAPPQQILARVLQFVQTVEARTGKKTLIYTSQSYFPGLGLDTSAVADYPLILAYLTNGACIGVPRPWSEAPFWQYTWHGRVPGIRGEVDRDRFNGTLDELIAFAGGGGGGALPGGPATVASNADGRLEVFTRARDGGLSHAWQLSSGGWSAWASFGGAIEGTPAVAQNQDGRLEAFVRGADGALYHLWQNEPNGIWTDWAWLDGRIDGDPVVIAHSDGRLEVFARGTDAGVWHIGQVTPNGLWGEWQSIGGAIAGDPAVAANADGTLAVVARGADGAVCWVSEREPNGRWGEWRNLGGVVTGPVVLASNVDGRLEAFARARDDAAWHAWQLTPNGPWSAWASIDGGIKEEITIAKNQDGRLELFARGPDDALWHTWQRKPGGAWSGWETLRGTIAGGAGISNNADGRLEAFVRGSDDAVWHIWQLESNSGWGGWVSLGRP
jgi:GH25 family lysozyme M1 (1,4-beta-N-acetylmuramidase)